jgi:hypothetical protein
MSLGNVSYSRVNEDYFRQAIYFLRRASDTPGFPLPAHLQRQVLPFLGLLEPKRDFLTDLKVPR